MQVNNTPEENPSNQKSSFVIQSEQNYREAEGAPLLSEALLDQDQIFDFIGVGFGPSNLALAVVGKESDLNKKHIFFEKNDAFQWHSGIMFEDSKMQISFLKDLATLRNPASPYTFLQYAKAKGRLEKFVNLKEFHPTRLEYQDYLKWVANEFANHVKYGTEVLKVSPVSKDGDSCPSLFCVQVKDIKTSELSSYYTRNLIYAPGGKPRAPDKVSFSSRIIHSSEFLRRFPLYFANGAEKYEFIVIGDGQSAGEIVLDMFNRYRDAQIHFVVSGYAPRPVDNSPFVNETFFSGEAEAFYFSSEEKRKMARGELRNTNYGVIDIDVLWELYHRAYLDEVRGNRRLTIHRFSKLVSAEEGENNVRVIIQERSSNSIKELSCHGIVLATGYNRNLDETIFRELLPFLKRGEHGEVALSRNYRVETTVKMNCRLYLQGHGEASHGLGDTLLSLLPFRSKDIWDDICSDSDYIIREKELTVRPSPTIKLANGAEYPPKRHLEDDLGKLYAVMERFKFATLISVQTNGEPIVTQVPLILDKTKGRKGVLWGHMDRANPHVDLLAGRRILALFHGPNAYISPYIYETSQLPTWNSITVHVSGRARILNDRHTLVQGLMSICEQSDKDSLAYRLNADDPRIDRLINYIVGFEIDIDDLTGRFKLSQDRMPSDTKRAAIELMRRTEEGERTLIEQVMGYQLR